MRSIDSPKDVLKGCLGCLVASALLGFAMAGAVLLLKWLRP